MSGRTGPRPRTRTAALGVLVLALVAACGSGEDVDSAQASESTSTGSTMMESMDHSASDGDMNMGDIDATPAGAVPDADLVAGDFALLDSRPEGHDGTAGTAELARHDAGTTVTIELTGLVPDESYLAHVHDAPCNNGGGGAHYKFDPDGADTPPNEIHLAFVADEDGIGRMTAENHQVAGPSAVSVVVHPSLLTDNRIACADLS